MDNAADRLTAFNRFGMGPRPGDLAGLQGDVKAALKAELALPDVALIDPAMVATYGLAGTTPNIQSVFVAQEQRRMIQAAVPAPPAMPPGVGPDERTMGKPVMAASATPSMAASTIAAPSMGAPAMVAPALGGVPAPVTPKLPPLPDEAVFRAEARARFAKVQQAQIGFVERLVAFWSNHFCVAVSKGDLVRVAAGSYEREAIRPNVLGRFVDMVLAVERHPAMLFYLDNAQSVGPDSPAGQNGRRGLNENLAREIMELHTLGVDGGYGQGDVTSLARVLTGWTFAGREGRLGEPGSFVFNRRAHEPGDAMVAGKAYLQEGEGQGERALTDLARHPATARHIATKLARHFIADEPPPAAVDRLAKVFLDRDGDLRAMASTLVDMPESWATAQPKLRSPNDVVMASMRLLAPGPPQDAGPPLAALRGLGMPLWNPPGPNGFADTEAEWGAPEGMKMRLDLAAQAAARAGRSVEDPPALVEAAFGGAVSDETRLAIARAATREQAVALLLMAPEFQRR